MNKLNKFKDALEVTKKVDETFTDLKTDFDSIGIKLKELYIRHDNITFKLYWDESSYTEFNFNKRETLKESIKNKPFNNKENFKNIIHDYIYKEIFA